MRLFPEGLTREFLLAVVERLGLNPNEVAPEISIDFAGDRVQIHLTALLPMQQVIDLLPKAKDQ